MIVNRRQFVQSVGALVGSRLVGAAFASAPITAAQLVERIKAKLLSDGTGWQQSYFDGYKAGDPDTIVRGIAVTFAPTLDVLQRSVALGFNFVVCHESMFWEGFDPPQVMKTDPVRLAKEAFVREHDMVVWRLHDHMHRMEPEIILSALLHKLDWTPYFDQGGRRIDHVEIPEMQLDRLAAYMQSRLQTRNVVVVGDPSMPVRSAGFGIHVLSTILPVLRVSDVAIVGETAEYDTFEYFRDVVALGHRKGLIRISHQRLEEWGLERFAAWLKPLVADLPMEWISAGEAFSVPDP